MRVLFPVTVQRAGQGLARPASEVRVGDVEAADSGATPPANVHRMFSVSFMGGVQAAWLLLNPGGARLVCSL